jgi:hypothetical protein
LADDDVITFAVSKHVFAPSSSKRMGFSQKQLQAMQQIVQSNGRKLPKAALFLVLATNSYTTAKQSPISGWLVADSQE